MKKSLKLSLTSLANKEKLLEPRLFIFTKALLNCSLRHCPSFTQPLTSVSINSLEQYLLDSWKSQFFIKKLCRAITALVTAVAVSTPAQIGRRNTRKREVAIPKVFSDILLAREIR